MNPPASELDLSGSCAVLAEVSALDGVDRAACAQLAHKLGDEVLPGSAVPLTSVVTLLHYGEQPSATVLFTTGEARTIDLAALPDYVTERNNPELDFLVHIRRHAATIVGIKTAIGKGQSLRQQGEARAVARRAELNAMLTRIDQLQKSLTEYA